MCLAGLAPQGYTHVLLYTSRYTWCAHVDVYLVFDVETHPGLAAISAEPQVTIGSPLLAVAALGTIWYSLKLWPPHHE